MVLGNRENIINALLRIAAREPDKKDVTMAEIAEEAGISRQAIYQKHYNNVNEIFDDIHKSITQEVYETLEFTLKEKRNQSIYDAITDYLIPLVYKYRAWGKILFHTSIDSDWHQFLQNTYLPLLEDEQTKLVNHAPISQKAITKAIMTYVFSIIAEWISEDFPDPPEIFAKKFKILMTTPPSDLVDTAIFSLK